LLSELQENKMEIAAIMKSLKILLNIKTSCFYRQKIKSGIKIISWRLAWVRISSLNIKSKEDV
jgi:hypothetical protein